MTNYPVIVIQIAAYIFMLVTLIWVFVKANSLERNAEKFKKRLIELIKNKKKIDSHDIKFMREGLNISLGLAQKKVKEIYYESDLDLDLDEIKNLAIEIQKEEPFEELSDDLKPTLMKINEIITNHGDESEKHLLIPITTELKEFQKTKITYEKTKKLNTIAFIVTVFSLIIGTISLVYTVQQQTPPCSSQNQSIERQP